MKKNTWVSVIILFLGFIFMLFVGFYATSVGKVQDALLSWHMAFALLIGAFIAAASRKIIKEIKNELEKLKKEIMSRK